MYVGFWSRTKTSGEGSPSARPAARFAVDSSAIPPEVFGLESYTDPVARAGRVTRATAIQVGAVKRARDLIPGTLGTLPFVMRDKQTREIVESELLADPERDVPASVTYAKTFDDMFFEGVAWWHITEYDDDGFPLHVVRLEPGTVDVMQDGRIYDTKSGHHGQAVRYYEDSELIRFDSPNDPFLVAAARAIRICLNLDGAAAEGADGVPPVDYFTPAEGVDPGSDAEVQAVLDAWQAARKTRRTGYVPAALKYNSAGWDPEKLQLVEQRDRAVLDIARHAGVDAEELGVSTTSRTYNNQQDRRKAFTDFTLGGYLRAFEDRLSKGDVSRPNHQVRVDLSAFLRSDDLTRMQTYEIGRRVGAYTLTEIREAEQKPPLDEDEMPDQESNVVPLAASNPSTIRFGSGPAIRLGNPAAETSFAVDVAKRTITGLAVPYGVPARSDGQLWQFSQGTLQYADPSRVKLWINHDSDRAVGFAQELDDRPDGMYATFKVARGAAGDEALSMAEDGVWDGFSIGLAEGGKYVRRGRVNHAVSAPLMEISLTPAPAFDDARVHAVAASATNQGEKMTAAQRARLAELRALNTLTDAQQGELETLEALEAEHPEAAEGQEQGGDVAQAVAAGVTSALQQFARPIREVVRAGRPLAVQVREESPYRFGIAGRGKHDFSQDIIAGLRDHDQDALSRVGKFMEEAFPAYAFGRSRGPAFDVDTADVNELNPTRNRPEMYVGELEYSTPMYDALFKGALEDITPFMFPKFNSSSGLVSDHVEGVEPTPGTFTATGQTVTPSALSGKVEITREVWDQGGNPQVSNLIWTEMQREWKEELESYTATLLASSTPGSGGYPAAKTITAGAADDDLVNELEAFIATLQFIRGGNRFTKAWGHANLYQALVDAVDADGRKLLPIIGATNANGQAEPEFASLRVGGKKIDPAWALGAASSDAGESFLVNPADVHVWNSAPKRLTFEYRVAYVDLAVWGYKASAISRPAGVQSVLYDPVA